jgi:hypothetical protein
MEITHDRQTKMHIYQQLWMEEVDFPVIHSIQNTEKLACIQKRLFSFQCTLTKIKQFKTSLLLFPVQKVISALGWISISLLVSKAGIHFLLKINGYIERNRLWISQKFASHWLPILLKINTRKRKSSGLLISTFDRIELHKSWQRKSHMPCFSREDKDDYTCTFACDFLLMAFSQHWLKISDIELFL